MRLHALRVQGLRAPKGIQAIPFHPEYSAVRGTASSVRSLLDVVLGLLAPEEALERLRSLRDPGADGPARVVLTVQLSDEGVYRIAADLDGGRLVLARFDAEEQRFVRVARSPGEAQQILQAEGAPGADVLETLAVLSPGREGEARPDAPVAPTGPPSRAERLEWEVREIEEALRAYAPLSGSAEKLGERIGRYRAARQECDRELAAIERARRGPLDERARLRNGRPSRAPRFWVGVALVAYGGVGALLVEPWLWLLAGAGALLSGASFVGSRTGRGRVRRLDARLTALRVREQSIERRFESEARPVRTPMVELGLRDVDELERAVREWRTLERRLEGARRELAGFRSPEKPEAEAEGRVTATAASGGTPDARLSSLLVSAAAWTGQTEKELRAEIAPALSVYLSALSGGSLRGLFLDEETGVWRVHSASGNGSLDALSGEERAEAETGFQLALLERLGAGRKLPTLVAPAPTGEAEPAGLAGALARLARACQVVQFTEGIEPWRPAAPHVHLIS